MSASNLTLRGRKAAERLMVDTCTVKRATGTATNPTTGAVTPTYTTIYTGKCRLQQFRGSFPETPDAGEARFTLAPFEVHVPTSATGIKTNDLVEVTASFDAANVGRKFRVRMGDRKTFQTALRLQVEELTA